MTVDVELESAGARTDHAFLVRHVKATVDTLKFSIRESRHDFLYKVIAPLAQGLIKKTIGLAVEQAIKTGLEYVDEQLVEVRSRMDAAKDSDSESFLALPSRCALVQGLTFYCPAFDSHVAN